MHLHNVIAAIAAISVLATAPGCKKAEKKNKGNDETTAPGAPGQSAADLDTVLAKIGDVQITVREFQERINKQSPYIRARYTSKEQKKEFLDNMIKFEVLAAEAQKRGFDKDPDVIRSMKQMMIQKLMRDKFEKQIKPEDVTDAEVQAYYNEHKNEYNKPETIRVSAVIVKGKAKAKAVGDKARGEAGKTNRGFRELVNTYSIEPKSKARGGDMRYFGRDSKEIPKPVIEAAFALQKTGDVAGPIAAGGGQFYIIKQTGRRKAVVKQIDDVKRQIQNRLYRDKRTAAQKTFIDGLKNSASVEVFDNNLGKVKIDTSSRGARGTGHGHGGAPGMPAMPGHPGKIDPPPSGQPTP